MRIMTGEKAKMSERIPSLCRLAHNMSSTDWPEIELEAPHVAVVPLVCVCMCARARVCVCPGGGRQHI